MTRTTVFVVAILLMCLTSLYGAHDSVTPQNLAASNVETITSQITRQANIKASNSGANDLFGDAVAISGDTLVIGAPYEDSRASGVNGNQSNNDLAESGAAYVFVRNGTNWTQQAYLKASNPGTYFRFGFAVAIHGDTLVVGAPDESNGSIGVNGNQNNYVSRSSGSAYVFVRSGTNWSQQAYLKPSNTATSNFFGGSVAISGSTILIGSALEDSSATGVNGNQSDMGAQDSGAVYVFERVGASWYQQAYLKASNTGASDYFGFRVALSDSTALVGAYGEASIATGINGQEGDNTAAGAGAAYVFVRDGTNWSQEAYLKASNTAASDYFGGALGLSADTAVIGAIGEDSNAVGVDGIQNDDGAQNSGAVYVFVRKGSSWLQQAYLKASNSESRDYFGRSVSVSGEVIVVGADFEDSRATGINGNQNDNSASACGAAYVFERNGASWSQRAYLKSSNYGGPSSPGNPYGILFGSAVAVADGTAVVGAWRESGASGSAYIFSGFGTFRVQLVVSKHVGNVRVVWPLAAFGYLLEETDQLQPPPNLTIWSQVPFPYQTNMTDVSVTLPMADGRNFYRLRKP